MSLKAKSRNAYIFSNTYYDDSISTYLKFTKLKVPALLKMCAAFIYLELYNIVIVAMFLIPVVAAIPALIYQIVIRLMQLF